MFYISSISLSKRFVASVICSFDMLKYFIVNYIEVLADIKDLYFVFMDQQKEVLHTSAIYFVYDRASLWFAT